MTHVEFKKEALYFHAQTLANLGEDVDNCFFKPVLEGTKPQIGSGRFIFLFKGEIEQMSKFDTAYFEFAKRDDDGNWKPKSDRRELYKLVHNGYPDEHAVPTNPDGESFGIPVDELILVMDYAPAKIDLDRPSRPATTPQKVIQPELNFQGLDSIFDKPLMQATLGDLVQVLKTLK